MYVSAWPFEMCSDSGAFNNAPRSCPWNPGQGFPRDIPEEMHTPWQRLPAHTKRKVSFGKCDVCPVGIHRIVIRFPPPKEFRADKELAES